MIQPEELKLTRERGQTCGKRQSLSGKHRYLQQEGCFHFDKPAAFITEYLK